MFKTKWQKRYEELYFYMKDIRDHREKSERIFSEGSIDRECIIAQKVILNDVLRKMKKVMES